MNLASVTRAEAEFLLPTYDRHRVLFTRGKGVYLWDENGKRYLDFLSGIGVNALGHRHPAVQKAIRQQAGRLIHISNLFFHEYQSELARQLTKLSGLDRAFFCNSGTEAWEGALKIARAYAQARNKNGDRAKWRILVLENSFHGRTFGSLATTGQPKYRAPFEPLVPGVRFVKFNDVADLKRQFDSTVCAVGIETIQGEGGVRPISKEFLKAARESTRRQNALLLLDEIQCGLGRTGRHFAYQHYGITPDLVTVAKPIAAGLPLGAILATKKAASCIHPGMHGTTFGGGPLACSVALEVVKATTGLLGHVDRLGRYFRVQLEQLRDKHDCIRDVRGMGLMVGMELDSADTAKVVVRELLEQGVIINRTNDTVLRFLPPYVIQKEHVDHVIRFLDRSLPANIGNKRQISTRSTRT
jgi:acetylornithine aminotransferase/acetylornithine/N-succinyldiaminopimelate aminotransferase